MLFVLASFAAAQSSRRRTPGHRRLRQAAVLGRGWALPFEIASVMLIVALVGAVWWTREGDE